MSIQAIEDNESVDSFATSRIFTILWYKIKGKNIKLNPPPKKKRRERVRTRETLKIRIY